MGRGRKERTCDGVGFVDVEEGGHAFPFGEGLFELEHFVLQV